MKFKSLLVLGAMLFAGASAQAQWTTPVPQATSFAENTELYMYNVEAKGFFVGANAWGTQASVGQLGYKVKFTAQEELDIEGNKVYVVTDSAESKSAWKEWFVDNQEGNMFVDRGSQANYFWALTDLNNGKYRISTSIANPGISPVEGTYVGLDPTTGGTVLNAFLAPEGNYVDWQFVTVEAYNEYVVKIDIYNAAVELGKTIEEAKEAGVDASAAEAVYNNTNATKEELEAATAALKQAILDAAANSATPQSPKDMSGLIENSTFDVIGDFHGWSGTAFGAGGTTGPCAEHYQKSFDTWQEVSGLPKGVYALTCDGFYRAGGHAESLTAYKTGDPQAQAAKLYAINANDTVQTPIMNNFAGIVPGDNSLGGDAVVDGDYTYYVPNSMASAVEFFQGGKYNGNKVMFGNTGDAVKIGVKKDNYITTDWSIFDTFRLTYYGNSAEAYQMWNDDVLAHTVQVGEIKYVTTSVIEAYNAVKEEVKTAASYDDVMGNIAKLSAAEAAITENVAAWTELQKAYQKAWETVGKGEISGDDAMDLADILGQDFDEFLELLPDNAGGYPQLAAFEDVTVWNALTTEQVIALAATLEEMREVAVQNGLQEGTDFTSQLTNVDFANGWTGWTHEAIGGGNVAANAAAHCAEGWNNGNFDIYQTVQNAPVGVYEISVQGFYRRGRGDAAWNYYFDPVTGEKLENVPEVPAYVYLNDNKTPLSYVFDYQVPVAENYYTGDYYTDPLGEFTYPNNMADAGLAFDHEAYTMSAFGLVAQKGDALRIGVKGNTTQDNDSWAIFTRFKLTYQGFKAEIIKPELQKALDAIDVNALMGSDVLAEILAAKAAGEEAIKGEDGRAMFNALAKIFATNTKKDASIELFKQLSDKKEALEAALNTYTDSPVFADASTLYYEVDDAIKAKTYTDAQATEAIAKIDAMLKALKMPADINEASDSHEVDMTVLVETPGFQTEDYTNSIEGWQGTSGYNFGNNDTQKSALAVEFYEKDMDMYQDIVGLPNGTYRVTVDAFYRKGSSTEDFEKKDEADNYANMYAVSAGNTFSQGIKALAAGATDMMLGMGAESEYTDADGFTWYMPNDMVSAAAYFELGSYSNELYAEVIDGTLRIGIKVENHPTYGWLIMDNWKLWYLGTESSHKPEIDAIEYTELAPNAKAEFFTINGMKSAKIQKGLNIIRYVKADGSVEVRKFIVK